MKGSASALGLDKMIDEKRDAKSMSERVVHIEVRSLNYLNLLLLESTIHVHHNFLIHQQ